MAGPRTGVAVAALCLTASGCASSTEERRAIADVVALGIYSEVDAAVGSMVVPRDEDVSDAAPGTPGGYRRAAAVRDRRVECAEPAVDLCGARVEVFATPVLARGRVDRLRSQVEDGDRDETVARVGAVVLRVTGDLEAEDRDEYVAEFEAAVARLTGRLAEDAGVG